MIRIQNKFDTFSMMDFETEIEIEVVTSFNMVAGAHLQAPAPYLSFESMS